MSAPNQEEFLHQAMEWCEEQGHTTQKGITLTEQTVKEITNTFVSVTFVLDMLSNIQEANDLRYKLINLNHRLQSELLKQ
tara:strand:- start:10191 stop:10430 length:240 start_codon:yes stop_codon:yes gene_type:complete